MYGMMSSAFELCVIGWLLCRGRVKGGLACEGNDGGCEGMNDGVEGALSDSARDFPLIQFDEVLSLLKVSEYLRKEWLEPPGKLGI
jgi:hypothetical protein